jgi:hypothetical protein
MSDEKQPGYPNLKRTRGPGRPKGSVNKVTATAKENIIAVFSRIGGEAAMAKWALENPTEFYKLYSRLIPVEQHVSGTLGHYEAIPVEQRDELPADHSVESAAGAAANGHSTALN